MIVIDNVWKMLRYFFIGYDFFLLSIHNTHSAYFDDEIIVRHVIISWHANDNGSRSL